MSLDGWKLMITMYALEARQIIEVMRLDDNTNKIKPRSGVLESMCILNFLVDYLISQFNLIFLYNEI